MGHPDRECGLICDISQCNKCAYDKSWSGCAGDQWFGHWNHKHLCSRGLPQDRSLHFQSILLSKQQQGQSFSLYVACCYAGLGHGTAVLGPPFALNAGLQWSQLLNLNHAASLPVMQYSLPLKNLVGI